MCRNYFLPFNDSQFSVVNSALCKNIFQSDECLRARKNIVCLDISLHQKKKDLSNTKKSTYIQWKKRNRCFLSYLIWIVWLAPSGHSLNIFVYCWTILFYIITVRSYFAYCNMLAFVIFFFFSFQLGREWLILCRLTREYGKTKKLVSPKRHQRR